jgi:hypothetical protein
MAEAAAGGSVVAVACSYVFVYKRVITKGGLGWLPSWVSLLLKERVSD